MRTQTSTSKHQPSTTMTVRLKASVKRDLAEISASCNRSNSYLAAEALEAFVKREVAIVRGIERGLADVKAGHVIPHNEAMDRLDSAIEAVARRKKK